MLIYLNVTIYQYTTLDVKESIKVPNRTYCKLNANMDNNTTSDEASLTVKQPIKDNAKTYVTCVSDRSN